MFIPIVLTVALITPNISYAMFNSTMPYKPYLVNGYGGFPSNPAYLPEAEPRDVPHVIRALSTFEEYDAQSLRLGSSFNALFIKAIDTKIDVQGPEFKVVIEALRDLNIWAQYPCSEIGESCVERLAEMINSRIALAYQSFGELTPAQKRRIHDALIALGRIVDSPDFVRDTLANINDVAKANATNNRWGSKIQIGALAAFVDAIWVALAIADGILSVKHVGNIAVSNAIAIPFLYLVTNQGNEPYVRTQMNNHLLGTVQSCAEALIINNAP